MPDKATWLIDKFDGGVNNHADPRDLPVNQFVELRDVAVHRFGKIETRGGATVLETLEDKRTAWEYDGNQFDVGDNSRTGSLITAGTGLFTFATDRNAAGSVSKEEWLLMPDPTGHSIDAFAYQTGAWQNEWLDPGTGTGLKARYLYKDGAIRVSDANGSAGNYIKWKGYIDRVRFGQAAPGWTEVVNSLTAPADFVVKGANTPSAALSFNNVPTDIELLMDTYDDSAAIESEFKKIWEFASSYLYDDNQESLLTKASTTIDLTAETDISRARIKVAVLDSSAVATKCFNLDRVSHIKIYMREVGTDDWLLQAIFDVTDGGGLPYEDSVLTWTDDGGATEYRWSANTLSTAGTYYMPRPLDKYDYEFEAGHPPSVKSVDIAGNGQHWKTAVIANRKAYVANVKRNTEVGDINEQDAIYVSLPGQYDKLPSNRKLETVGSDGEEVIRLMLYKDKILEFKDKTLRIINISGEFEFVEDTFYNAGIQRWEAAFETPFGIAFGNRLGAWLYTGEGAPINLLKRKINDKYERTISLVDWNAFYTRSIMVGYNPTQDQLIILRVSEQSSGKHCYTYTFSSQSWVYGQNAFESSESIHSNFITDRNNALIWYYITTGASTAVKFRYWEDAPLELGNINIKTKDITFDMPDIHKYVYNIKISYKLTDAGANLTNNVDVSIDGENSFKQSAIGNHSENTTLTGTMVDSSSEWKTAIYTFGVPILVESLQIQLHDDATTCKLSVNEMKIRFRYLPEYEID